MLFKISIKNIIKSIKDYAIYFFTLILGVAIFYVFNAIGSQSVMLDVSKSTSDIIDLMNNILSGVSVFVSFILGFLIIYASRFLMKRRNKEFGIYLTLGMSKRKISLILFIETLIIGVISLVIGLVIGVALSQLMSVFVSNMFEADLTKFEFIFSQSACIKCFIYFGIMYILVMFFNTFNISKCKLIDLLHSNKKSEKIKLKNSLVCTIIFIISVLVLSCAYYLVTGGIDKLVSGNQIFIPIALGCISTFFIFWSLSGLLLKIVMSFKGLYYKGLNSFTLRQISSKINTTVFSMTVICLMLFITICVLSSALSIKNSMTANLNELAPADIQLTKRMNLNDDYTKEEIENSKLGVIDTLKEMDFNINDYLKESVEVNIYQTEALTLNHTLGSLINNIRTKYPFLNYDSKEDIMKLSDYNKIARFYGNEEYSLDNNEYMIIADFKSMIEVRNIALNNDETITIFGSTLKPKYKKCRNGFIEISSQHINSGIIVVPDSIIDENYKSYNMIVANYNSNTKEGKREIESEILSFVNESYNSYYLLYNNTRIDIAEASIGLGAMVTFIGLYLGIIFLISSATLLALKELAESSDNKQRFRILRRIGADEKLINRALFRQIAIFFMFPLLLAIIHSIFGIKFSNYILETFGNDKLLPSIIMTSIFIVIIYGGYFLLTYLCSRNIIRER